MARFTPRDVLSSYASIASLNANFDDIAALLEKAVFKDGTSPNAMVADLDFNHFKIQNVGNAVDPLDAVNLGQLISAQTNNGYYTSAGTDAQPRTVKDKLDTFVTPEDFGAKGVGNNDDTVALQRALNTGKRVYLAPGKTYGFGAQLFPPSGGGFIGGGKLLMLTNTGQFVKADYSGAYGLFSGIHIENKTNVKVEAEIELQATGDIRTVNAIGVWNCTNVDLDVECYGFKESLFGVIEWNSNIGGHVKAYVHDCGTTIATGLPSIQITALSVDNNRVSGVNSRGLHFNVYAKNLTMGALSVAAFGYQTDGVNLQGATNGATATAFGGHTGFVRAENVHEPLDIFSDYNNVTVAARDCLYGVKLIHGASRNIVKATIHNTMLHGVLIAGTSTGGKTTSHNRVEAVVTGIGEFNPSAFPGAGTGVLIDGGGATYGCNGNIVNVTYEGDGVNLEYGAAISGGDDNVITYEGAGATQETRLYSGNNNVFKRCRPTLVRAYLSASTSYANDSTVVFNTEEIDRYGEFNPATGVFTAKCNCTLRVKYSAAGASIAAGGNFGSYIRKGGTTVSRKTDKNFGAGASDVAHEHTAIVTVIPGDTIFIRTDTSTSISHYGNATYLEITEV